MERVEPVNIVEADLSRTAHQQGAFGDSYTP